MTTNNAFSIDDTLGTSDNLAAFAAQICSLDAPLGAILSPHLGSLAAGQNVDTGALWDALYAGTALADSISPGAEAADAEGAV